MMSGLWKIDIFILYSNSIKRCKYIACFICDNNAVANCATYFVQAIVQRHYKRMQKQEN